MSFYMIECPDCHQKFTSQELFKEIPIHWCGINLQNRFMQVNNLNNNKMDIKERFVLALTKEPQKSFRKVGITNGDDILTNDGEKVFLSWLLHSKFAEEFKKDVVVDMLEEVKKEEDK